MDESSVSSYTTLTGSHSAGNQYSTLSRLPLSIRSSKNHKNKRKKRNREDTSKKQSIPSSTAAGERRPFTVVDCNAAMAIYFARSPLFI
ncbi:SET domain-containing protein [Psidium guajava]|nr:SET domain-containing protein [Psidium guajava]